MPSHIISKRYSNWQVRSQTTNTLGEAASIAGAYMYLHAFNLYIILAVHYHK